MKDTMTIKINGKVVWRGENVVIEPEHFVFKLCKELEKNPNRRGCMVCSGHGYYYFEPGLWRPCYSCKGLGSIKC